MWIEPVNNTLHCRFQFQYVINASVLNVQVVENSVTDDGLIMIPVAPR